MIELLAVVAIIGILAGVLIPAIGAAVRKANKTVVQGTFKQWATAISSYKSTYGYYPPLSSTVNDNDDTEYLLNQNDTVRNFVRSLSGKNLDGTELSDSDIKEYNPRIKNFCSFDSKMFKDNDPTTARFVDHLGNEKIHVLLDTDGNNLVEFKGELPGTKSELGLLEGNKKNVRIVIYVVGAEAADKDGDNIYADL
jgi:type II secretory pathway pseudopilin PulG